MANHIIFDSEFCLEKFLKENENDNGLYYTTSPYLLNASRYKDRFSSLEKDLNRTELDNFSKATYDIATDFSRQLNELCPWRDYADLNLILAGNIQRCCNAIFYKGFLLSTLTKKIGNGDKIICVGDTRELYQDGLELQFGRFDTLFVHIATRLQNPSILTFQCELPDDACRKRIRFVTNRKFSRNEKILSFLTNTPGSFCYKTWKNLVQKRGLPFQSVRLRFRPRKHFYFYKDSELTEELFLSLLLYGASISFLPELPKLMESPSLQDPDPDTDRLSIRFGECARKWFHRLEVPWNSYYDSCVGIVSERIHISLERLRNNLPHLTGGFEAVCRELNPEGVILTNSFSSGVQRLFACFCKSKRIKTIVTEHGLTTGYSEYSKYREAHSVMTAGDVGIYHSEISARQMELHAPEQSKLIFGLPSVTAEVKFPFIQRSIARRLLGLDHRSPLVIYVCDLERNNYYFGPHTDTDHDFVYKTKTIVRLLARRHPGARICLKLYPTMRYYERYTFEDLRSELPLLFIPEDVEFRFIRAAADHIYTTSFMSTLGWVIGSGKPYTFIKVPWSPVPFSANHIDTDTGSGFTLMAGGISYETPTSNLSYCAWQLVSL